MPHESMIKHAIKRAKHTQNQTHQPRGSASRNGAAAGTAPAWCSGAPRSRRRPPPCHPADPGACREVVGEVLGRCRGGEWVCGRSTAAGAVLTLPPDFLSPLHGRQVLHLVAGHAVLRVGLDGFLDAVQQAAALRHRHLQVLLRIGQQKQRLEPRTHGFMFFYFTYTRALFALIFNNIDYLHMYNIALNLHDKDTEFKKNFSTAAWDIKQKQEAVSYQLSEQANTLELRAPSKGQT